jgi:outer membrane lipoprotein SlyB
MRTKLLVLLLAALALSGCADKPTHAMSLNVYKKYPGAEIVDAGFATMPTFYVRPANGSVRIVQLKSSTDEIYFDGEIFPPNK